jgi:hypothetical protein
VWDSFELTLGASNSSAHGNTSLDDSAVDRHEERAATALLDAVARVRAFRLDLEGENDENASSSGKANVEKQTGAGAMKIVAKTSRAPLMDIGVLTQ